MNAIEAKQNAIKEFENYLQSNHYTKGTLYAAVSKQTGDVVLCKTLNGALQLGLSYTFEVSRRFEDEQITAVICDY